MECGGPCGPALLIHCAIIFIFKQVMECTSNISYIKWIEGERRIICNFSREEVFEQQTAAACCIASITGYPNPSQSDGMENTVHCEYKQSASSGT
jgi:hypothetical protein